MDRVLGGIPFTEVGNRGTGPLAALLAPAGNDAYLNRERHYYRHTVERAHTHTRTRDSPGSPKCRSPSVCKRLDDWSASERRAGWGFQKVEAEFVHDAWMDARMDS